MESHSGPQLLLVLVLGGAIAGGSCAPNLTFGDDDEAPAHCANGAVDGDETDQDCGGPSCAKCDNGLRCLGSPDCSVGSCVAGICQAAHCVDGEVTGDESDEDCGGLECLGCARGQSCRRDSDCLGESCDPDTRTCASGSSGGAGAGGTGGVAPHGGDPGAGGVSIAGGRGGGGGDSTAGATASGASGGTGTGATGAEGGIPNTGGASLGGDGPGGAMTGGTTTGGDSPGGAPTGGAPTGGIAPGGAGGAPTGGAPTGGAPTGGMGTGGLPVGFYAIDMLDVVNSTIELQDGQGEWYTFHDRSTTGTITPDTPRDSGAEVLPVTLPTPRDGSLLGVHVVADAGFTEWGAGVGFNLNSPDPATRLKYDVSPYTGMVFWGRAAGGDVTLRVKLVTAEIAPTTDPGGECTADCNDAFGYEITLTNAWQEFPIPFANLVQQGWGATPPGGFDPTSVLTVQLHVDTATAFDIWLDDVRFYD